MPALNFHGLPQAYIYARVEESLYNWIFIGRYKSVAYQVGSTTLPEGCSSCFVHWFPVWYSLQPRIFTRVLITGLQGSSTAW